MKKPISFFQNDLVPMIRWFVSLSRGIRMKIASVTLLGVVEVVVSMLFIVATKRVVDVATHSVDGNLFVASLWAGGLLFLQLIIQLIDGWFNGMFASQTSNRVRHTLYRKLMLTRWNELERYHTGDTVSRLTTDVGTVSGMVTSVLPGFLVTIFQLLASLFYLQLLDRRLAGVIILLFPLFLIFSKLYVKPMRRYARLIREDDARMQSLVQESFRHRLVIKTFRQSNYMAEKLIGLQRSYLGNVWKRTRLSLASHLILSAGFSTGYLIVFLWGAYNLNIEAITFGTMTAFLQLIGRVQRPAADLVLYVPTFINAWVAAERIRQLEELPSDPDRDDGKSEDVIPDGLRLRDLTFRYEKESEYVLSGISFDFKPGSSTAVVGETGAGKTTLLRLLLGLLEPENGSLELYTSESVYPIRAGQPAQAFVYVPQGNTLFSGTIRENLLLGNPDATDHELHHVLEISCADFVYDLSSGLDTYLSEGGGGLSEGQAQRLAIARSLLRSGKIMLFDEVTSALDPDTELQVLDNIRNHFPQKTLIYITHHPLLMERCEGILKI